MLGSSLKCTECGAPIRRGARLGLCPACSFRAAVEVSHTGRSVGEATSVAFVRRFGDYDLLDEVGRGGMGVVFRARQRSLGRIVALKVLLGGGFAGEEGRRRLRAEAAAAARLVHPNIVAVHEAGEVDGQPFYSMDFVEGCTLAAVLGAGAVAAERAARHVAIVAGAVQHAHVQGVLHRDLKPSNILIGDDDQPRVADFGLAKPLFSTGEGMDGEAESSGGSLTLTGQVLGSPAYMSPEQALGDSSRLGPASDVYSLGAILYELLVARPPFQGGSPQVVLDQVRTTEPVGLRRLNAGIPLDLETICLKCLEKVPAARYASAGELAEDLHRFLRGEPVRARPIGWPGRAWRAMRRYPLATGLALLSVGMLIAVAVISTLGAARISESRDEARKRLAESLISEARALRLAGESGHRELALSRLDEARSMDVAGRLRSRLRNETIAVLARPDVQRVTASQLPASADLMLMSFDPRFELCSLADPQKHGVSVFRVRDGALVVHLPVGFPDEVTGFSADGRFLALRYGGAVGVWEVASGRRLLSEAEGEGTSYHSGAFSPDGRLFGRAERGRKFVVYRMPGPDSAGAAPEVQASWALPGGRTLGMVAWAPDGKSVALTLDDNHLALCEVQTGAVRWQVPRPDGIVGLAWNAIDDVIAACTGRDSVVLVAVAGGETVGQVGVPGGTAECLAISPDGGCLAASNERFGTRLVDPRAGRSLGADPRGSWHLHFDPGGRRVGTLFDAGHPAWLERLPSPVVRSLQTGSAPPESVLEFSPDGRRLLILARDGAQIWEPIEGRRLGQVSVSRSVGAALGSAGERLLVSNRETLIDFDLRDLARHAAGPLEGTPMASGRRFWGVAASHRRGWVAVADHLRGLVQVFDHDRRWVRDLGPLEFAAGVSFSPDGRWLASGAGAEAMVWDLDHSRSEPVYRFAEAGESVRFSPDGQWLLTCGKELGIWRVGSWEAGPRMPLEANNSQFFAAALSPDGAWLAATQSDHEIHLLDFRAAQTLAVLDGPGESRVLSLLFSPDGKLLAAARDRGEVQVWDLPALRRELSSRTVDW